MSTQRDELIQTIREGWPAHGSINYPARGGFAEVPPVRDGGMTARVIDFAVDTVLASTKPRTITTVEELDALGFGAAILHANNGVLVNDGDPLGGSWVSLAEDVRGGPIWLDASDVALPATVLYEPAA